MVLEIIALVDYLELVLARNEPENIYLEPIETIYLNYTDTAIISQIDLHLQAGSYQEILDLINQYKEEHKELLQIYEAICEDYESYKEYLSPEDLAEKLSNNFGLINPDEVLAILMMRDRFLVEH
ncbi:MAG: hypothetical protein ACOCXH_02360 [Cyclobacteriaceae bacterium]